MSITFIARKEMYFELYYVLLPIAVRAWSMVPTFGSYFSSFFLLFVFTNSEAEDEKCVI